MSYTPFKQWRFPLLQGANGHAFGMRINKGIVAGATGPQRYSGSIYTASQIIQLDPNFLPLSIGEWERTRHDIGGVPAVPKIEITLQDALVFTGISSGSPVFYDLSSVYSSLLDELCDDPTIVYEIWLDDYLNGTLFEIWFCGDMDYGAIPILHKGVVGEGTSHVTRYQEYTITANFAVERLIADHNKDTTDPVTGGIVTPGSIFHFAYGYNSFRPTGAALPLWLGTAPGSGNAPNHLPIYPGVASSWSAGNTGYGHTGAAASGVLLSYCFPTIPDRPGGVDNITSWSIEDLCNFIADYAGMTASLDSNLMFEFYAQIYSATTGRFSLLLPALTQSYATWQDIFVNIDFLFGNGIPFTGSYDPYNSIHLTGSSTEITGTFLYYDTETDSGPGPGTVYFRGSISGASLSMVSNNDTFTGPHTVNGENLTLTGTLSGAGPTYNVEAQIPFGGSTIYLSGTYDGTRLDLRGSYPVLFSWPNTIGMDANVLTLAAWIAAQTGTWIDSQIDTSGNVTMAWRARRPQQGAALFTFKHLSYDTTTIDPLIIGSNEDPSEITQSTVIVQCQGNGLQYMAGRDPANAVTITVPWQCHKQGHYSTSDNGSAAGGNVFYNPNNDVSQCIEQWWNTQQSGGFLNQSFCVTVDAKVSRGDPNTGGTADGSGDGDYQWTARTAIPTKDGWCGGSMLLWKTSYIESVYPLGSGNMWVPTGWSGALRIGGDDPHPTGAGLVGVGAIVPAGVQPPLDEFAGGYFNPQYAYAQVYYQEIVGCNGQKLTLIQDYIGCRGDDGYMQSLRPGIIYRTLLRGKARTMVLHNVKIRAVENTCTLQWEEVPTDGSGNFLYNSMLPDCVQVGAGGSGVGAGGGSSSGGGGGAITIPNYSWLTESLAANQNDWNLSLTTWTFISVSASTPITITGLANGTVPRLVTITNTGTHRIDIAHRDSASDSANQFILDFGGPLLLEQDANYTFFYDTSVNKWRQQ